MYPDFVNDCSEYVQANANKQFHLFRIMTCIRNLTILNTSMNEYSSSHFHIPDLERNTFIW